MFSCTLFAELARKGAFPGDVYTKSGFWQLLCVHTRCVQGAVFSTPPEAPASSAPGGYRFDTPPTILRQKTKVDSANRMIISQIMRIFVAIRIRACACPRPKADILDRKGRCGHLLRRCKSRRGMGEFC